MKNLLRNQILAFLLLPALLLATSLSCIDHHGLDSQSQEALSSYCSCPSHQDIQQEELPKPSQEPCCEYSHQHLENCLVVNTSISCPQLSQFSQCVIVLPMPLLIDGLAILRQMPPPLPSSSLVTAFRPMRI